MYTGRTRWLLTEREPAKEAALSRALGDFCSPGQDPSGKKVLIRPRQPRSYLTLAGTRCLHLGCLLIWSRLLAAWQRTIEKQEPVTVYGDYDVDGVTAAALLVRVIGELGGRAMYYTLCRAGEGYGLHQEALAEIKGQSRLVVTVDCGIGALAEAEYALAQGMELVITDHHQPGKELPKAAAVVNPNRPDCPYPTKELAGVGVAFKLAQGTVRLLTGSDEQGDELACKYLDLVALGTVADVVPLVGENRILVQRGMQGFRLRRSVGLTA